MKFKKISLGILTPSILAASLTLSVSCSVSEKNSKTINLFNHKFKNREEMIKYVLQNSERIQRKDGDVSWIINNGDTRTFTNYDELSDFIGERIKTIYMKSTMSKDDLQNGPKNADLSIVDEQIKEILASTQTTNKNQRFYRGIKDSIFDNKADAIKSYFQYHKIYNYNKINFRSKSELKLYLSKHYDEIKNFDASRKGKSNLIAPSGGSSDFFNFDDLTDRERARNFIKKTANKYIQIKRSDGTFKYLKASDLISHKDSVPAADFSIGDVNAFAVKSNNGDATWITDSLESDKANFYGDYFSKNKSDQILNIKNHQIWRDTPEKPGDIVKKSKNAKLLGNFFQVLNQLAALSQDNLTENERDAIPKIKGIFDVPKYKKYIANMLQNTHSNNLDEMIQTLKYDSSVMSKGKRYNPLYELPILYQKSITSSEKYGLRNKEINELRKFFEMVVNDYQDVIDALFNRTVKSDREGKEINLKYIFGINDYSFDLSSTPQSAVYKLSESTAFMEGIQLYFSALSNKTHSGGTMPFETSPLNLQNSIHKDYLKKLWFVLSGDQDELKNPATRKSELSKDLGRKLTNVNVNVLFNIIKSQSLLDKSLNKTHQKAIKKTFEKNISEFQSNGTIDINKINTEDYSKGREYEVKRKKMQKIIQELEYVESKTYKGKIKTSVIEDNLTKLNTSTRIEFQSRKVLKKYITVSKDSAIKGRKLTKKQIRAKRFEKMSEIIRAAHGGISIMVNVNHSANVSFGRYVYDMLKTLTNITGTLSAMTRTQPAIAIVFIATSFALDFIAEGIGKDTKKIFRFKTNEQGSHPFYWDGGLTRSHFWGLWDEVITDKSNMQIMQPIKILDGVKNDYIYYNGKRYNKGDETMVKNQALIDFAHGDKNAIKLGSKNSRVKMVYSYDKDPNNSHFDTAEELAKYILPINKIKKPNNNHYDKYKFNSKFSVIGGQMLFAKKGSKADEDVKRVNITKTIEVIKPILVSQVPELINSMPKDQTENKKDNEPFIIPGKYYSNGIVKEWSKTHPNYRITKYLELINLNEFKEVVTNSRAKEIKSDPSKPAKPGEFKFTEKTGILKLEEEFLNKVDVQSIYTSINEVMHKSHFSNLKKLNEMYVFKAKGVFGRDKYFKSYLEAFKWLISKNQYQLKTLIVKGTSTHIKFNKKIFPSTKELLEYVDQIIIEKGKQHAK